MAECYELVALHDRQDLMEDCVEMLNKEWQRSGGMRARSLNQSNEKFPYNVVMLEKNGQKESVVGHAKMTKVLHKPESLYVSSVIIKEHLRGKGLGKKIMKLIEDRMRPHGFKTFHLRTDTPEFYIKCGYNTCDPVQEVVNPKMEGRIEKLLAIYGAKSKSTTQTDETQDMESNSQKVFPEPSQDVPSPSPAPPPPPPPPPPTPVVPCGSCKPTSFFDDECEDGECKYYMTKDI